MPFKACVISTGGGVVERRKNWGYMQHGIVVWLNGQPELLARRACQDDQNDRPLLEHAEQVCLCLLSQIDILDLRDSCVAPCSGITIAQLVLL